MDILTTKLFIPALRPSLVARPRLLRKLDQGVQQRHCLTLVSAPAGYGKTTLIAEWTNRLAESQQSQHLGWLSLDQEDNDPGRFLTYLLAALRQTGLALAATEQYLQSLSHLPPPQTLVTTLLNEISQASNGRSLLLVLDDYHKIQTAVIHETLQFWLDHAPPHLHLVLITREDPPLTLSRWRARSQMTEIRASDLRFTLEEAADFLNHTMGLSLTAGDIAALEQRTEGWIASLQLAALALQASESAQDEATVADFIARFSGSHHYIIDYLVEEVLRQQDETVRDFLRETAVLHRFNADLCDAVTGRNDSQEILNYLERHNLFLVPLDNQRQWYRYHHLLADSLRAGLDDATQNAGHRQAAAWFAAQKWFGEAIVHADAADDTAEVARLVRLAAEPALQRGEFGQIAAWLKRLPHEIISRDAELGVFWLLSLILTGRSHEVPAALAQLEQHQDSWNNTQQQARLLVLKAYLADIVDSPDRIALAKQAAQASTMDDPLFRAFVAVPLGHAHLYRGQLQEAVAIFREGLSYLPGQKSNFVRLSLLSNLIHSLNHAGRRQEAAVTCQETVSEFLDAQGKPLPPAGLLYLLQAWLHYDANDLTQAQDTLAQSQELMQQAFQATMLSPLEIELAVLLHEAAGKTEKAAAALQAGLDRATRQKYQHGILSIKRIEAELLLRQERPSAARHILQTLPIFAGREANGRWHTIEPVHDTAYLAYARLLLAEGQSEEAQMLLALLATSAREGSRERGLISILLLQAVSANEPNFLTEAVQRAGAASYPRLILDECAFPAHGPQLVEWLQKTDSSALAPTIVDALPDTAVQSPHLLEPLTDQEMVVLRLLADGRSNRQIAEELVITVGTAKWHVHNIYQKLDVSSRAEAVARIHDWQLLEP